MLIVIRRVLARLVDLDSTRFDLAVSKAKPLLSPSEHEPAGRAAPPPASLAGGSAP